MYITMLNKAFELVFDFGRNGFNIAVSLFGFCCSIDTDYISAAAVAVVLIAAAIIRKYRRH